MVETWDEGLEKILGKKRCAVCKEKLEKGKVFVLKNRKFFHEKCYRKRKAEKIKNGAIKIDEFRESSEEIIAKKPRSNKGQIEIREENKSGNGNNYNCKGQS